MTIDLTQHWQQLTKAVDISSEQQIVAFEDICTHYSEPHRVYHTLTHLKHFIESLEQVGELSAEVYFALYYHDVIYKPGNKANEQQSAALATKVLTQWQLDPTFISRVSELILMTESHKCDSADSEACLFLDADMAILGSPLDTYLKYADKVRREFRRYPNFIYNKGRTDFLRQTLKSERIFLSEHFHQRFEQQARSNIAAELQMLEGKN